MKNHIAPNQVFMSLFTLSMFSLLYSASIVIFDNKGLSFWSITLITASSLCLLVQLVFLIKYTLAGKRKQADEYTTALLHKASYYAYMIVIALISMMFVAVHMLIFLTLDATTLDSFLSTKVVLGIFAVIQLTGSTLYILLYYFFNKKGEQK